MMAATVTNLNTNRTQAYNSPGEYLSLSRSALGKAGLAGTAAMGVAASFQTPARADSPGSGIPVADIRPRSVVLVHGLYADGSSWIDGVP